MIDLIKKDKMSNLIYQLLLIACIVNHVRCVNCNTKNIVDDYNGTIESPNYPDEREKTADCTWEIHYVKKHFPKKRSLVLDFVGLRLYFAKFDYTAKDNATRYCPYAHNLTINGEAINCTRLVSNNTKTFCKAYYEDQVCANQKEINHCETKEQVTYPVSVHYKAKNLSLENIGPVFGFKINFHYVECKAETTIVPEITDSQTTSSLSVETTSNKRPQATYVPSSGGILSTIKNGPDITMTSYFTGVTDANSSMLVNVVVPISVVLLLVALAILIVVVKRKRQQSGNPSKSDQSKVQASSFNQSGGGIYSAAEDINQSSPQRMSGAGSSNQSEQGQSNHVSIINQSDVAYSTVEKIQGTKQTVEYHKTMVDNVLYGETGGGNGNAQKNSPDAPPSDEAETVVNVLYGETGGGNGDAQKNTPCAPSSNKAETVVNVLYGETT
uniref:uncharacterized protein LOC120331607 isoform X2 n=1 Tax=Styela clava TaxID=7725 RepID=UPI001939F310|nr:uncharacterized protein LOC120331607 isoform X2 [Styela clava]